MLKESEGVQARKKGPYPVVLVLISTLLLALHAGGQVITSAETTTALPTTKMETTMNLQTTMMESTTVSLTPAVDARSMTSTEPTQSESATTLTSSQTTPEAGSSGPVVIAVVVVLIFAIAVVVIIIGWWFYKHRTKQSHSFHDSSSSPSQTPTFRALSTWEEAIGSVQKVDAPSDYPSVQFSYCTPDLIAGTSESQINRGDQYGRLRNDTITSEVSTLQTIEEVGERPRSSQFENPVFQLESDLDGLDSSLFKSNLSLDGQEGDEYLENENEKNLSKSTTLLDPLGNDINNPDIDLKDKSNPLQNEDGDDGNSISTEQNGLSIDLHMESDDKSHAIEDDTNSEDIESGIDNTAFEMDTDVEGNGTSSEAPTVSSELDISR